jgi:tRNA G10  N-methylase Trm11
MRYVHDDEAWAKKLEEDFETYMSECMEFADADESELDENFETVSGEPYCGCSTCYSREVIMFLMPRIIDAYKAGILTEEDNG